MKWKPDLGAFTPSGQEMDLVYSTAFYRARTGQKWNMPSSVKKPEMCTSKLTACTETPATRQTNSGTNIHFTWAFS